MWALFLFAVCVLGLRKKEEASLEVEGPGPAILQGAIQGTKCTVQTFDQLDYLNTLKATWKTSLNDCFDEGANGICYGLSLLYLQSRSAKTKDKTFLADLEDIEHSGAFNKACLIYIQQKGSVSKAYALAGLEQGLSTVKPIVGTFPAWVPPTAIFTKEKLAELVTDGKLWTVGVPKHTMAAFTPSGGPYRFFDPNSGVLKCASDTDFVKAINAYFSDAVIHGHYKQSYTRAANTAELVVLEFDLVLPKPPKP